MKDINPLARYFVHFSSILIRIDFTEPNYVKNNLIIKIFVQHVTCWNVWCYWLELFILTVFPSDRRPIIHTNPAVRPVVTLILRPPPVFLFINLDPHLADSSFDLALHKHYSPLLYLHFLLVVGDAYTPPGGFILACNGRCLTWILQPFLLIYIHIYLRLARGSGVSA